MEAILEVVERLNAAWSAGEFDQLVDVFDPGVVLVAFSPEGAHRVVGRDAVIQSYREFAEQSVLHQFELQQPELDVFGTTAIATCPYTIDYEIGGRRWIGEGRDLLVLHEGEEGWKVVWRSLFPGEEQEVGPERPQAS
jgi:ketosteroid isomerase-like protein